MEAYSDSERIRVLYIDDDTDLISIYSRFFENSPYALSTAVTAEEGLETAKDIRPALIISDVILPGISGIDLCRMIRKEPSLDQSIVMLVTGIEVDSDDIATGFEAGADEYLMKPFSRDELFARIQALLRIHRLKREAEVLAAELEELRGEMRRLETDRDTYKGRLSEEQESHNASLKKITMLVDEREIASVEIKQLEKQQADDRAALIDMLGRLIEAKPQYNRGHSLRVAELAGTLAGMMGLDEDEVEDIRCAGRLHELGKISIPEALSMTSPPDYSEAERDLLMLHPVRGAQLLGAYSGLSRIAKLVRHIHEQVNGDGFPDSLKKEGIPLGSRIIAVVNLFDGLVCGSAGMTPPEALEVMEPLSGIRYDSKVCACLRRHVNETAIGRKANTREMRLFEIKPGMQLAVDLYTAKGAKLLPENTILTQETIDQIARYNKIDLVDETIFIKD